MSDSKKELHFLKNLSLFSELEESDLNKLLEMCPECLIKKDEILFSEGSEGDSAFIIKRGEIEIFKASAGDEIILARRKTGEVIGEMSLFDKAPRMAGARALVNSVVIQIQSEPFFELLQKSSTAWKGLLLTLLSRWRDTENILKEREKQIFIQAEELREKNNHLHEKNLELQKTLSDLKEAQDKLVESEKMASLGALVASVAHEINTPIGIGYTASTGLKEKTKQFAETYESGNMSRKDFEKYLESIYEISSIIAENLHRTAELVQSFKQVSIDRTSEKKRVFSLDEYLEDITRSIKPFFKGKDIRFIYELEKSSI